MSFRITFRHRCLAALLVATSSLLAQNTQREMMERLDFLVGEWIGTTEIYENGAVTKRGAAFERIAYDLDTSILVIELNTEFLQLRTIIRYDEADGKYYYHRFSKSGAAVYPAEYRDGELVVQKDDRTRFFFGRGPAGGFREYGEQLIDGQWTKIFEDTFINTQ